MTEDSGSSGRHRCVDVASPKRDAPGSTAAVSQAAEPADGPGADVAGCVSDCGIRREADHRIANHLTMLAGYVRLKAAELERADAIDPESVRLFARSIDAQISSLARLHRLLTKGVGGTEVDLSKLLHDVCGPFADGLGRDIVLIEDYADGCTLHAEQALPVAQIVGEGIINAAKHAYRDGRSGVVLIRCLRQQSGVCIKIIDYGVGLPAAFDPTRDGGLGFRLMRDLSEGLRATLGFTSGPEGLRMSLALPPEVS